MCTLNAVKHPSDGQRRIDLHLHASPSAQMALCESGSLASLLAAAGRRGQAVPEALCWRALAQVAAGLDFLHGHGVLHLVRSVVWIDGALLTALHNEGVYGPRMPCLRVVLRCLCDAHATIKPHEDDSGGRTWRNMCVACQDIKPGNIFLDGTGTFQIGDFGLAVLRQQWVRPVAGDDAWSTRLVTCVKTWPQIAIS